MTKISIYLSNDLVTDQRMQRIARTLIDFDFKIHLIGIKHRLSKELLVDGVKITRLMAWPRGGLLFYIFLQIRFFFKALFDTADIFWSVDLDTLMPIRIASYLKRKPMIWDCHEIFSEIPELYSRPLPRKI